MMKKDILKYFLHIIVSTIVLFILIEILLMITYFIRNSMVDYVLLPYNAAQDFGPTPPWLDDLRILERDEDLLFRNRRNVRQKYMDVYSPVHVEEDRTKLIRQFLPKIPASLRDNPVWEVSLNSAGFRNKEFPNQKTASVFRIICLGDSWTFGSNVNQEDAYPQQLRTLLKREFPMADFEVFNLGVMSYSSYQGLKLLKKKISELDPNLLIVGFAMNDASVPGYRDKDYPKEHLTVKKRFNRVLEKVESYKLAQYLKKIIKHKTWTIGDYMQKVAAVAGTPDEAWIGREGHESADYEKLEPYTRVSPKDFEKNFIEIIRLARKFGADTILLYTQLWDTPHRHVLEKVSKTEGVSLVDSKALIDRARTKIEDELEETLDLRQSTAQQAPVEGESEVILRVYSGMYTVPESIYIAGAHPLLGDGVPNKIAMYDDETHGDQRAGDMVWSYAATFSPGTKLLYVYTNSGEEGKWEGLDVPEIRRFTVKTPNRGNKLYRPIETFGKIYMQADGWHTNAEGYKLIAKALISTLKENNHVKRYLDNRTNELL
jgi:lysophospholipase L1-like esterase